MPPQLFMKKLNQREIEVARVMSDLFFKGIPETRVAEYCILKKMTEQQLVNFLNKLPHISEPVRMTIHNTFRDLMRDGQDDDRSRGEGYHLPQWLDKNYPSKKVETSRWVEIFEG